MMWLVLSLVVICLIVALGNRSKQETAIEQNNSQEIPLPSTLVDVESEDEYLIIVITAAIHEFTGTENFEVVRFKPSAKNWTLIGRQNLLANR